MAEQDKSAAADDHFLPGSVVGQVIAATSGAIVGLLLRGEMAIAMALIIATALGLLIGWWARAVL